MEQEVVFGQKSFSTLKNFIDEKKCKSILLVTGKSSFEKCGAKQDLFSILTPYKITRFSNFEENPKIEDVEKGVSVFNNNNCDIIIAVGGGSCMDIAKLINFFKYKDLPYSNHLNKHLSSKDTTPLVAIPTTAGSGSEATHFAVVYVNNFKYSVANKNLKPNFVLINSSYLKTLPIRQLIYSSLDAFCQGIESFWSINSNATSAEFSKTAIIKIWNNLENAINGNEVWDELSMGAYQAGKAIDITKTTGPHSLSYGFTDEYGITHGHAVSLFLPFFVDFNLSVTDENSNDPRGPKHTISIITEIAELLGTEKQNVSSSIINFFKRLNVEINFQKLGISLKDFKMTLEKINHQRLKNNPRIFLKNDIGRIYDFNSHF